MAFVPDSVLVFAAGRVLTSFDGPASRTKSKSRGQGHF